MNKQKNKKQGFSFVELSIYVGIFGVVAFLLFNIFGEILNFSKIANKQDVEDLRYRISPIEFDLDFPKRGIVTPNPRIPFPPEDPVRVLPGMIQYCSFQWMQTECDLEEEAPCWVCECKEVPCDNVAGCAGCHHLFVEDPLNYPGCECVDIRAEMREKRNDMGDEGKNLIGDKVFYWYDIFNPSSISFIPIFSLGCSTDADCQGRYIDTQEDFFGTCEAGKCSWPFPSMRINNPKPYLGENIFSIDNYYQFAWSDNLGWINFENINLNPISGAITGQAVAISGGDKISLNCRDTNSCSKSDYKITLNTTTNELEGYAWSDNFGWFSFNCKTGGADGSNICATSNYKVTVNPITGIWDGYAWNGNTGWVSFNCETGGQGQASVCGTSNYKVMDSRTRKGTITYDYVALHEGKAVAISQDFTYNTHRTWNLGGIIPTSANVGSEVSITSITGSFFYNNPLVKIIRQGVSSIFAKDNFTFVSQDLITDGKFDLKNARPGVYDLHVIDFYGNIGIKENAFTVK